MSTPVIHTLRPISGLAEDCESFAVVRVAYCTYRWGASSAGG